MLARKAADRLAERGIAGAPPLFSTNMLPPAAFAHSSEMRRAAMSALPPVGCGRRYRQGHYIQKYKAYNSNFLI